MPKFQAYTLTIEMMQTETDHIEFWFSGPKFLVTLIQKMAVGETLNQVGDMERGLNGEMILVLRAGPVGEEDAP